MSVPTIDFRLFPLTHPPTHQIHSPMTSNALLQVRLAALSLLVRALARLRPPIDFHLGVSPSSTLDFEKRTPRVTDSLVGQLGLFVIWKTHHHHDDNF